MFLLNGTLAVDTFFLISGLLNAFVFFTVVEKTKRYRIVDVLISYVHRFIR
jgi:peptidoglycan/LPS O-acetylase OafA/YrhL